MRKVELDHYLTEIFFLDSPITDEQKLKKFNLIKSRGSILEVFFTLKTMPLSVFRYQVSHVGVLKN